MLSKELTGQMADAIERGEWAVGSRLPSVRTLAEQYGVSLNTVQRALRPLAKRGLIEQQPRRGVFVRRRHVLSSKTRHQVGVIWSLPRGPVQQPQSTDPIASEYRDLNRAESDCFEQETWEGRVVRAAEAEMLRHTDLQITTLPYAHQTALTTQRLCKQIDRLGDALAGVMCFGRPELEPVLNALDERNVPWISINPMNRRNMFNFVQADNVEGGMRVGGALAQAGLHRVLVISMPLRQTLSHGDKLMGLYRGFLEEGVSTQGIEVAISDIGEQAGYETIMPYLRDRDLWPQVIFANGDFLALGALRVCRELNIRIPQDISIITATGLDLTAYTAPPLTALAQPMEMIGTHVGRMLVEMIREEIRRMVGRKIPSPLIFRGSDMVPDHVRRELEQDYQQQIVSIEAMN